ncbi:hypothetical protein [Nostoc flagelliforme]|uniref:hypothetical protein n=1 Tax=Nostoc flagelliforme TaxID=1306274 RepID=UPI00168697C6|nr:hypothetical protein [Nostoc flagelliforme]
MGDRYEELELHLRPRTTETVSIKIPTDTLRSLEKVAANRDMKLDTLLKFYIGQSLQQDIALERAIKEGENTETVSREAIFKILDSKG